MPHKPHRAVHADEGTLDEHGCCRQSDDNVDIFVHGSGWSFRSHHDSILGDEDLRIFYSNSQSRLAANYSSVRDLILTSNISNGAGSLEECGDKFSADELHISDSCHVRIPPMLFAKDVMEILPPKTIPSSSGQESNSAETSPINRFGIKISATDGILCWAIKHTQEENCARGSELQPILVSYAKKWSDARNDFLHGRGLSSVTAAGGDRHEFSDSTDNRGSANRSSSCSQQNEDGNSAHGIHKMTYDWTFSSDYCCTLFESSPTPEVNRSNFVLRAPHLNDFPTFSLPRVAAASDGGKAIDQDALPLSDATLSGIISRLPESGIDFDLLKKQDEPILFYDEMILYQDDLEDSGEVCMEAKLRVMPRCWYLLLKHFIRVDGVVVMCRETRLFHKFLNATTGKAGGSDGTMRPDIVVFMDVVWRKYSFESTQSADTNISIPVASGALSTASIRPPPAPTVPGLHSAVPNHAAAAASLASKLMSPQGKAIAHLIPVTQITSKEDWSKCEMERGSTIHYAIHL